MAQRSIEGAGGTVAYSVTGDGPALVLLHPIGMDKTWWEGYTAGWAGHYRVIAIDLLGHGASGPVADSHSLAQHAADVLAVIRQENAAPAVIAGVSMGGMVAQYAALQDPALVAGVIACATAGAFSEPVRAAIRARGDVTRDGDMRDVVDATMARWFSEGADAALLAKCRARLLADDWHSWSANWAAISELDTLEGLRGLDVQVLVVAGDADASIPVAVSRQIADAAPQGHLVVMPGASHFGAFESPAAFKAAFDAFLDSLSNWRGAGRA